MPQAKVKIVLDADVVIHFAKGGMLSLLPDIFPECEMVLLDIVKREILPPILGQLENQMALLKNIKEVTFGDTAEQKREFARLTSQLCLGRGESACMVYCRFNNDVVGSSNLRDITDYCDMFGITYLTTLDFLYYAIKRGKISETEAYDFITSVNQQGSILPTVDFSQYICNKM